MMPPPVGVGKHRSVLMARCRTRQPAAHGRINICHSLLEHPSVGLHCASYCKCVLACGPCGCAPAGGAKPRWEKQVPEVARCLGWCTWDAFYTDVSAQGIFGGLQSFKQAGVQPRWIIIDDGWQVW